LRDGYEFPSEFSASLALTKDGIRALSHLSRSLPDAPEPSLRAAVFAKWAGRAVAYVDTSKTDLSSAAAWIGAAIQRREVTHAWLFGRDLHDRYVEKFGQSPRELTHQESIDLIDGMAQGVTQAGPWISGPLGLVRSTQSRLLSPETPPIVIRCEDPACPGSNRLRLRTGETVAAEAFKKLDDHGPIDRARWRTLLDAVRGPYEHYDAENTSDLPWLVANGLLPDEIVMVADDCFSSATPARRSEILGLNAGASIERYLTKSKKRDLATVLQCLLVFTDAEVIESIDRLVCSGQIVVAEGEVRRPPLVAGAPLGAYSPRAELGREGLRFSSQLAPMERLRRVVGRAMVQAPEQRDWLLRNIDGDTPEQKMQLFLATAEPGEIVTTMLFGSQATLRSALESTRTYNADGPSDDQLRSRILWKLGFVADVPPREDAAVLSQLEVLFKASSIPADKDPGRVEPTRAAGNELGVRLEALLTLTLEYGLWALLADHFDTDRHERFTYSPTRAHEYASPQLRSLSDSGFDWRSNGKNALGTIVEALVRVADFLESLRDNALSDARDLKLLPRASFDGEESFFPFPHKSLLGDLSDASLGSILVALRSAERALVDGGVVELRNKFDHHSQEEFPRHTDVSRAATAVRSAVSSLAIAGLIPITMCLDRYEIDRHRRLVAHFVDGDSGRHVARDPDTFSQAGMPGPLVPQLIMASAIPQRVGVPVRFAVRTESTWRAYWRGIDISREADRPHSEGAVASQSEKGGL
jgi:hypothetical protein